MQRRQVAHALALLAGGSLAYQVEREAVFD
jgi:hypothetical protein